MAGLPWIFILQGPLVSVLFALFAAFRANQLWQRSEMPSLSLRLAIPVFVTGIALGHPASSTWPDHCFALQLTNGKGTLVGLMVAALVGLAVLVCLSLVECQLRRRLRQLRGLSPNQSEAAARLTSVWVGTAGLAWSVLNETLFPVLLGMLLKLTDRGSSPDEFGPFRDACNPEVGWVGAAFYGLALVVLVRNGASTVTAATARAPRHRRVTRVLSVLLVALFLAQCTRTFVLLRRELPQLKTHGGDIDCKCMKYDSRMHVM
jgi:hypothetical protein